MCLKDITRIKNLTKEDLHHIYERKELDVTKCENKNHNVTSNFFNLKNIDILVRNIRTELKNENGGINVERQRKHFTIIRK